MTIHDVYFLARHTPFWSIPLVILGAEFGYMFWLKKKKKSASFCAILMLIGVLSTAFYVWAGGPEKSVKIIKKWYINNQ